MLSQSAIPSFALFGEASQGAPELLHIEEVQSRSRAYQWEITPHRHQGLYQVLWLEKGEAEVALDGWRGKATGPSVVVIPPGAVHGFRFVPESVGQVLTLSARILVEGEFEQLGPAVQALFAEPVTLALAPDEPAVARLAGLLGELAAAFQEPASDQSPVSTWLARAVVWRLAQLCARQREAQQGGEARHQALFTRFMVLVEQHFLAHWPVSRYASRLGLSVPRLNRVARAATGRNALELVHERLTREACRKLVYVAAPVASLALELGFEDPAYFGRFFRRRTGQTPQGYRETHR